MKVIKKRSKNKLNTFTSVEGYDYYIGLDYSQDGYSLARLTPRMKRPQYISGGPSVEDIKNRLSKLRGKKLMTIEETTSTHWLYVELKDYVDKIVVCDPYRNSLLSEGAKNDEIDAGKLSLLLRGGFLKEVYHSMDKSYEIRKLVSSYGDLIKAGVRVKNQQSSLYRSLGKSYKEKESLSGKTAIIDFIELHQKRAIRIYEEDKRKYVKYFERLRATIPEVENMCQVSGIDTIGAIKIYATVIDAERFANKNKYWGYCGLVNHQKQSGNRNYGKRKTRYSRLLKSVYKTAAIASIRGKSDIGEYYEYLLTEKNYTEDKARNAVARYIAKTTLAMMRHKTEYIPYMWKNTEKVA